MSDVRGMYEGCKRGMRTSGGTVNGIKNKHDPRKKLPFVIPEEKKSEAGA